MTYLTYLLNMLGSSSSTIVAIVANILVYFYFLRPRFKWWFYPALVTIIVIFIPILYMLSSALFGAPISKNIFIACLGYLNGITIIITFRENLWTSIAITFTVGIFNRLFTFWGYILYIPLCALTGEKMNLRLFATLIIAIMYTVILLVCRLALRDKGHELTQTMLSRKNWIVLAIIAASAKLIIDFCSDFAFSLSPYSDGKIIFAMIALSTFAVAVLVLYVYNTLTTTKSIELKVSVDLLAVEKDAQRRYYETQLSNQEQLRHMKHDINGHLNTISSLLAEDKKSEAMLYLAELSDYDKKHQKTLYSDNPYLNSVVTNYVDVFAANSIPFEHDIKLGKMELHHVEMCLTLNNALQNALEASLKLPPEQRYVRLQVKTKQSRFLFRVTNRFDSDLIIENKLPCTTKHGAGHGYGLTSIRDAAESLGGFAVFHIEGDTFALDVSM